MANLESIITAKTASDTQWRERQQADRENTVAIQDAGIMEITGDSEAYARYLEMQADNPAYSVGNIALVMAQDDKATVFGTRERWKMLGRAVPESANGTGVKIFARSSFGKGYSLTEAFDVRQTQGRPIKKPELQDGSKEMEEGLATLLNYSMATGVVSDRELNAPALYDAESREMRINPDYPDHEAFAAIAAEVAHSRFHSRGANQLYERSEYELDAQSVSYMLCRRFGVERDMPDVSAVAAAYEGWDVKDRREALDQLQNMCKRMGGSIEQAMTPQRARMISQGKSR